MLYENEALDGMVEAELNRLYRLRALTALRSEWTGDEATKKQFLKLGLTTSQIAQLMRLAVKLAKAKGHRKRKRGATKSRHDKGIRHRQRAITNAMYRALRQGASFDEVKRRWQKAAEMENSEDYFSDEAPSTRFKGIPGRISWGRRRIKVSDMQKISDKYPKGQHRIYTIFGNVWDKKRKKYYRRPLYVGMAKGSSVASRIKARLRNKKFNEIMQKYNIKKGNLDVGVGNLTNGTGFKPDMKLLHTYELLLQRRLLNTKWHQSSGLYNKNVWTFEDLEEMDFEKA
jgi:hypothetical protein